MQVEQLAFPQRVEMERERPSLHDDRLMPVFEQGLLSVAKM
jgi:hypothetical protein